MEQVAAKEVTQMMYQRPSPDLHLGNNHLNQIHDSNLATRESSFRVSGRCVNKLGSTDVILADLSRPKAVQILKCVTRDHHLQYIHLKLLYGVVVQKKVKTQPKFGLNHLLTSIWSRKIWWQIVYLLGYFEIKILLIQVCILVGCILPACWCSPGRGGLPTGGGGQTPSREQNDTQV